MGYIDVQDEDGYERIELPWKLVATNGRTFNLDSAIRGGGNGVVFRATTGTTGGVVAVKVLRQLYGSRIDRFENEVRILANELHHDRICRYYGHGQHDDRSGWHVPWMAMELGGDNLRAYVEGNGPLQLTELRNAVRCACDALIAVHGAGFIHRDVKPDNFVLMSGPGDLKMIDFGIAKRLAEDVSGRPMDAFTRQQEFVGPLAYASPELIAYSRDKSYPVDHRSDLFQLGKVIWYAATGKTGAGVPSRKIDPTSGRLHEVMVRVLSDDPDDRPESASALAEQVLQALDDRRT